MSFFRLTAPPSSTSAGAETARPAGAEHEGLFARMFRLWIENHERIAQFRLLDQ